MNMKPRSPWALLFWPASLIALIFLAWISGYLYWQIRISRAVADVKRDPSKYFVTPNYQNEDLLKIGSRGFRRFIEELEGALARGEVDQAAALYFGLGDLAQGAWCEIGQAAEQPTLRDKPSMAEMRAGCQDFISAWPQDEYAPGWMWWSGARRMQ
jgi:hypothetical protein